MAKASRAAIADEGSLRAHIGPFFRELAVVIVGALLLSCLVRVFVGQLFDIPSTSMTTALQVGDRVLVEKVSPISRGDVVVFHDPGGWLVPAAEAPSAWRHFLDVVGLAPVPSSDYVVKRVVGMPGDTVVCCNSAGQMMINDVVVDESYLGQPASSIAFAVVVPAKSLFVLGDNRAQSRDSRCHLHDPGAIAGQNAFVPMDQVVGRAVAVTWPVSRWSRVQVAAYAQVPAPKQPAPATPTVVAGPEARC